MAISFFESEDTTVTPDNDFYGDWIKVDTAKKLKTTREYPVIEVIRARSNKGFMVVTTEFNIWLWSKAKMTNLLLEALEVYVKKGGYQLVAVPVSAKPDGYRLGVDKDKPMLWYTNTKKYTVSPIPDELGDGTEENPFL